MIINEFLLLGNVNLEKHENQQNKIGNKRGYNNNTQQIKNEPISDIYNSPHLLKL